MNFTADGERYVPLKYRDGVSTLKVGPDPHIPGNVRFKFDKGIARAGFFTLAREELQELMAAADRSVE